MSALRFPQRTNTHVSETESWRILQELAPKEWIVREVSERDYGIDTYIEITTSDGNVTGNLVSVQLKGVEGISWKVNNDGSKTAPSPAVKTSTALYWLNLPIPVFLFVADVSTRNLYFLSVKPVIRSQFEKLHRQETMTFSLLDTLNLRLKTGLKVFDLLLNRERLYPQFELHMTTLLSSIDAFGQFIMMNQGYDSFMEVDIDRHLQLRAIYTCCKTASLLLEDGWQIEPLQEFYRRDLAQWKDEYCLLHEATLDELLKKLQQIFPTLVRKALKLVSQTEAAYWLQRDPVFFKLCVNGELEARLVQVEQQYGMGQTC